MCFFFLTFWVGSMKFYTFFLFIFPFWLIYLFIYCHKMHGMISLGICMISFSTACTLFITFALSALISLVLCLIHRIPSCLSSIVCARCYVSLYQLLFFSSLAATHRRLWPVEFLMPNAVPFWLQVNLSVLFAYAYLCY